jgi:hypothetical protein
MIMCAILVPRRRWDKDGHAWTQAPVPRSTLSQQPLSKATASGGGQWAVPDPRGPGPPVSVSGLRPGIHGAPGDLLLRSAYPARNSVDGAEAPGQRHAAARDRRGPGDQARHGSGLAPAGGGPECPGECPHPPGAGGVPGGTGCPVDLRQKKQLRQRARRWRAQSGSGSVWPRSSA